MGTSIITSGDVSESFLSGCVPLKFNLKQNAKHSIYNNSSFFGINFGYDDLELLDSYNKCLSFSVKGILQVGALTPNFDELVAK